MTKLFCLLFAGMMFVSGATATFTIAGAVTNGGSFEGKAGMRVRQAVEAAGLGPNADLKRVRIESSGESRIVDLTKLGPTPLLHEGDKIFVPELDQSQYVRVGGAVDNPGFIEYGQGITIKEALAAARPYDISKIEHIKITRTLENGKTETIKVPLSDIQTNAKALPGDYMEVAYPAPAQMSNNQLLTILVIGILLILLID